jgi:hypothetical protein
MVEQADFLLTLSVMEISITGITRNRKFTKALARHSHAVKTLEQAAVYVNTFGLSFDILQLVFLDRSENYARAVGCKGDRLFQVEVPTSTEEAVNFGDEVAFVACIAGRLQTAVKLCSLPKEIEAQLSDAIGQFKVS